MMQMTNKEKRLQRLDNAWRIKVFVDKDFDRAFIIAKAQDRLLKQMQDEWESVFH